MLKLVFRICCSLVRWWNLLIPTERWRELRSQIFRLRCSFPWRTSPTCMCNTQPSLQKNQHVFSSLLCRLCFCLFFTIFLFSLQAISRSFSTVPMHLMWGPVNPTQMASLLLRTSWLTWCCGCLSGSWPSSPASVICLSSAWGRWFVLRTTCMLPASKFSAVSNNVAPGETVSQNKSTCKSSNKSKCQAVLLESE